jgi:DNA polymerase III alpha subunit
VRQRPGTANGVIFITLEDETGVCNVIVWRKLYEQYRRAVIAGRMLRITGRIQREGAVSHVIAEHVEDISFMLDDLVLPEASRATEQP